MTQTSLAITLRKEYIDIPVKKVGAPLAFSKESSILSLTHSFYQQLKSEHGVVRNHLKPFKSVCFKAQNSKNNGWTKPSYT